MPTLRRKLMSDPYGAPDIGSHDLRATSLTSFSVRIPAAYFRRNVQSGPTDEAGHYELNRSRSNAP